MIEEPKRSRLKVLRTGDTKSRFNYQTPKEILEELGRPRKYLLSRSAKIDKSVKVGVLSRVLYLTSGVTCSRATASCLAVCLGHSSGKMRTQQATDARDRRTALYYEDQEHFFNLLYDDIRSLQVEAKNTGMLPALRLNGTSDIPWERLHNQVFSDFPDLVFYDYTKIPNRVFEFLSGRIDDKPFPANYHITFSVSEQNAHEAIKVLQAGGNAAVVFWPNTPSSFGPFDVIDGDKHDARFLDPSPCIVGLSAKGNRPRGPLRVCGKNRCLTPRTEVAPTWCYLRLFS